MFTNYGTTGVPWTGMPPDLLRYIQGGAPAAQPRKAVKNTKKAFDYRLFSTGVADPNAAQESRLFNARQLSYRTGAADPKNWFSEGWRK